MPVRSLSSRPCTAQRQTPRVHPRRLFGSLPLQVAAMTPDVQVWISNAKNGTSYHAIAPGGRFTECGRYVGAHWESGGPDVQHGYVLPLAEVVDRFGSKPCRLCTQEARVVPSVRPSREAPWT